MAEPSDLELNAALARALGWRKVCEGGTWFIFRPDGTQHPGYRGGEPNADYWLTQPSFVGDYVNDRDRLPEIMAAVERAGKRTAFMAELYQDGRVWPNLWEVLTLPPRAYAVAALKALGAWPEGWEEGE